MQRMRPNPSVNRWPDTKNSSSDMSCPLRRVSYRLILSAQGEDDLFEAGQSIAAKISRDVSGGATLQPAWGFWVGGAEADHLSGPLEAARSVVIEVSVLEENEDRLQQALRAAILEAVDRFGLASLDWVHVERSVFLAGHFSVRALAAQSGEAA